MGSLGGIESQVMEQGEAEGRVPPPRKSTLVAAWSPGRRKGEGG
jgi:hypothetical protein